MNNNSKILKNSFVVIGRNEINSQFCVVSKNIIERQSSYFNKNIKNKKDVAECFNLFSDNILSEIILIDESNIINMINLGSKFFTYDFHSDLYTKIIVAENNIKTKSNENKEDNISNLPLLIPILFE